MKRILATLLVCAAFVSPALASDFVEAQMKFQVLENGKKDFSHEWSEEEELLRVRMGLTWDNYEEALHARGFNLRDIAESDMVYPASFEGCVFYKGYGSVPGAADLEKNEIFLEFKGPLCKEMVKNFSLGTIVVHFYDVATWEAGSRRTPVFRLQIWDYPAALR